jgi:hypothetical protein
VGAHHLLLGERDSRSGYSAASVGLRGKMRRRVLRHSSGPS